MRSETKKKTTTDLCDAPTGYSLYQKNKYPAENK